MKRIQTGLLLLLGLFVAAPALQAQYFGRNKPRYENFDFKVYETPHFEIYHYLPDSARVREVADWCEQWYAAHQNVLKDTIQFKNPLILYNDHADFQQTNAISGLIGVGTGGVTEALKNRVVLPLTMSKEQTHHVLGHELVHAFQYNMILRGDSTSIQNLGNLPLWMVEGLAEYMSIGRYDSNTAMWMRDAVLNDKVPTIKDLDKPEYFPYRWGQVFWAFLAGMQGDTIIKPFFIETAKYGLDDACKKVLQMSRENLSELWVQAIKRHYGQYVDGKREDPAGRALITTNRNGGRINISPVVSPDGRSVVFLSEKNLFSLDLFLANASNGEIERLLASQTKDGHIDDFESIESAGTWSPDSKQFAFVAVSKGRNVLVVKEVHSGKTVEELSFRQLPAFRNPSWSPDGRTIVVSGMVNGQTDLYLINVKTKKVEQLTNDPYAELHPSWSPDGRTIAFATDRLSQLNGPQHGKYTFNLAELDLESRTSNMIDLFSGADNLNPVYDLEGHLYFLSDRDGFRNLYQYDPAEDKVYQMTDLLTGISGITAYAPAISISRSEKRDKVLYSHYWENGYRIFSADPAKDFLRREVPVDSVDLSPAYLLKVNRQADNSVEEGLLSTASVAATAAPGNYEEREYKPKFNLTYVGGGGGVGVNVGGFGPTTGAYGGVDFLFSDILGNHQLFTSAVLNGRLVDFAGVAAYLNQKNRLGWGVSLSHIPYRLGGAFGPVGLDTLNFDDGSFLPVEHWVWQDERLFEDRVSAFLQYPFSQTLRVEGGASYSLYYNRIDQSDLYYDAFGRLVYEDRNKLDLDGTALDISQHIGSVYTALVGDNSYFAIASPLKGYRFRLGVEKFFDGFKSTQGQTGGADFWNLTADYRRYLYTKPVAFAFRALHSGRYGKDATQSVFRTNYIGYPWFVRGYFGNQTQDILFQNGKSTDILSGSKILVGNFEVRVPFTGPKQLALIGSKAFFSELAFFFDAGIAFDRFDQLGDDIIDPDTQLKIGPDPVMSAGASLRINLFGMMVLEPYYAFPIQKETKGVFGLNIVPGW